MFRFGLGLSNEDKHDIINTVSYNVKNTLDGAELVPSKVFISATYYAVCVFHFSPCTRYVKELVDNNPVNIIMVEKYCRDENIAFTIPHTINKPYCSKEQEDIWIEELKQSSDYLKFKEDLIKRNPDREFTEEFLVSSNPNVEYADGYRMRL